jgi:mannose-6-phosphate isomerase-like protein (cupin superfamily)
MRIARKNQIREPFRAPLGEEIYEMIGRPEELGGTVSHSLVHVVVPPGSSSPAHYHKDSEETYYILKGEALLTIDKEDHRVRPGDACLIMPGEVHQIVPLGDESLEFLAVSAPAWVSTDTYVAPS